jgi:hypothetical protein
VGNFYVNFAVVRRGQPEVQQSHQTSEGSDGKH